MSLCRGVSVLLPAVLVFLVQCIRSFASVFFLLLFVCAFLCVIQSGRGVLFDVNCGECGVQCEPIHACNNYYWRFDGRIYKSMILLHGLAYCAVNMPIERTTLRQ